MTEVQTVAAPKASNSKRARKGAATNKASKADLVPIAEAMQTPKKKGNGNGKAKGKGKAQKTPAPKQKQTANVPAKQRAKSFWLDDEKIAVLKAEFKETKQIPIPYSTGAYRSFLLALLQLGPDKAHPFDKVKSEMRALMNAADTKDADGKTAWQRFINKPGHSETEENCLNVDAKLQQNAEVLQRLGGNTPYGMKLHQLSAVIGKGKGVCIDILKGKGDERLYKLNLNAEQPTNEFRRARNVK